MLRGHYSGPGTNKMIKCFKWFDLFLGYWVSTAPFLENLHFPRWHFWSVTTSSLDVSPRYLKSLTACRGAADSDSYVGFLN